MLLQDGRAADQAVMEQFERLAISPDLPNRAAEAADMLLVLAHALQGVRDRVLAERFVAIGRHLSIPAAMELLIERAMSGHVDTSWVAPALRFGGVPAVSLSLRRLGKTSETGPRRVLSSLAHQLAGYPELREPIVTALQIAFRDGTWTQSQDALALLTALGEAPVSTSEAAAS
ncbi:MAG TPA: hypothetical protein VNL98_13145 [Gemmatimonadales bacterium]|nr:hypothetical protein [Gemmatimonadales bacterium]